MHTLLSALAKTAALTGLLIGCRDLINPDSPRNLNAAPLIISAVAARALSYYWGAGLAIGAWAGAVFGLAIVMEGDVHDKDTTIIGSKILLTTLLFGAIGYVSEHVGTLAYTRITTL